MMFQVLHGGGRKPKKDYATVYAGAFVKAVRSYADDQQDKDRMRRLIFYGVKALSRDTRDESDYEGLVLRFQTFCIIKDLIGQLTPAEMLRLFPLEKKFDGDKYQCKDYFSSIAVLRRHGLHEPIGEEATNLLWDYMNPDICHFEVECMCVMSAIRRAEGRQGLLEEFCEQQGKPLTVYYENKDSRGRTFMKNSKTGEVQRLYKKRPRYLRPVNG